MEFFNKAKTVKTHSTTDDSTHDDQRLFLNNPFAPRWNFVSGQIHLRQIVQFYLYGDDSQRQNLRKKRPIWSEVDFGLR